MLQRYDISMRGKTKHLSIKESILPVSLLRKREFFDPTSRKYVLTHKVNYDGDTIRAAIRKGKEVLISELRSDDFFPIRSCVEIIADKVIELSKDSSVSFLEIYFDDKSLLPKDDEENE